MSTATWNQHATSGTWNSHSNWHPAEVPTTTAHFALSTHTAISFSADSAATIKAIEFAAGASAYTFAFGSTTTPALTISGAGVTNLSSVQQSFVVAASTVGYQNPQLKFTNSASAGTASVFYCAGPVSEQGAGGGVISFCDTSTAGSATFKVWTGAGTPVEPSTVGGEVSFSNASTAATATFTIYGSLGTDGDTFGNVVFHDTATAAHATFTNIGGTVSGGDGGNTQFYVNSTADHGVFNNLGGTFSKANGGDVAFDGNATGGKGTFYNRAATVTGAYGGVTSFNNNPPTMASKGATAGHGSYHNYGALHSGQGGGGHTAFSAKYGDCTAGNGTFINYGSAIAGNSSAGHTIFSISQPTNFYPTAGNGSFRNQAACAKGAAAGYTQFAVYQSSSDSKTNPTPAPNPSHVPTAGNATFINEGASVDGAAGGYTQFSGTSTAAEALLIAHGGANGGYGGQIVFYDQSTGGSARVVLSGNGELNIGNHTGTVSLGTLDLTGGIISTQLGSNTPDIKLSGNLTLQAKQARFSFWTKDGGGFALDTAYTLLTAPNLASFNPEQFSGNSLQGVQPSFAIAGNCLQVCFPSP